MEKGDERSFSRSLEVLAIEDSHALVGVAVESILHTLAVGLVLDISRGNNVVFSVRALTQLGRNTLAAANEASVDVEWTSVLIGTSDIEDTEGPSSQLLQALQKHNNKYNFDQHLDPAHQKTKTKKSTHK